MSGKPLSIQLLEENTSSMCFDIGFCNVILDISSKATETKAKINKWNYTKLISSFTLKETTKKMKRPSTEEEIWKLYIWSGVRVQNIQQTHTTQNIYI